jgi:hypothetical protein
LLLYGGIWNLIEIGILEIHFHIKFLHTTMRICKTSDTNVTVFTTREIFSRIETYLDDKTRYNIMLKEDDESINSFLKRVKRICDEKIDLLFVNTIEFSCMYLPHYIMFNPKSKMILTVHVANHWLKARYGFNIKNIFRTMDANASILLRSLVLKKFNAINVIYPPIKKFVKEQTKYSKDVFVIPFNFYDKNKKTSTDLKDDKIRFVIPGLIEEYRRDYHTALDVFEKLFEKYGKRIILELLGEPVGLPGKKIIERCEKLRDKGYNIKFSSGFIPEEDYDKDLSESDIIFSPLSILTKRATGITEVYGRTEGSALPFEAIQYGKPLIIPEEFEMVEELKSSTLKYKNPVALEKLLSKLIEGEDEVVKLKREAYKNSQHFSLDSLQEYFTEEILNKLDEL